jgi:glutaredoxin
MQNIAKTENVIFYKPDCPFCAASDKLFTALVEKGIVDSYSKYYLHTDFDDELLTTLVKDFGWVPSGEFQENCTKPQIFVKGEYIGGNFEFYKSKWNKGDDDSGKLQVDGVEKETPDLTNPMRF